MSTPSTFVRFKDIPAGTPVILFARVSTSGQDRNGNLDDQLSRMRKKADRYGFRVIDVFREVAPGRKVKRPTIKRAIRFARKTGAVVVFETLDRMLRHTMFNPKTNPNARVSHAKTERFLSIHYGVRIAVMDDPHASLKKIKRLRTKRGQKAKGNTGGGDNRPGKMVRRRQKLLPRVIKLRKKQSSFRQIGKRVGIAPMVAFDWWHKRKTYGF